MSDLGPFVEFIRKSNRMMRWLGIFMVLFGAALWLIPAKTDKDVLIKLGIMGFFALFGVLLVVLGLQDPERHKALVALRERADDIVWIYLHRTKRNGQQVSSVLRLGLTSGQLLGLPIQVSCEDERLALVMARAPHARVGYDRAIEQQFKRDPRSLRR